MIPKIIHFCWFGGKEKPELIQKCIESWKQKCPDYEICEWNESNFDVSINKYTAEAYQNQKWAFVSDVCRIWVIYNYGGIYLDTDVEVLKNFDELLNYDMFSFFESIFIATGLGFGAQKGHPILKSLLDDYNSRSFLKPNGDCDLTTCPNSNSLVIADCQNGLKLDGVSQIIDNNAFLSYNDYTKFMKHYGTASWSDNPNFDTERTNNWKDTRLKRFLRKPSRMEYVRKHFGRRIYSIYVFCAYDLLENGIGFCIKRGFNKIRRK